MGSTVHVAVSTLADSGGNASNGPTTTSQGDYTISGGQITVTVPNMTAANAYQIKVTAGAGSLFDPNRLYEIANSGSGKALEDYNNEMADGATVDQWSWSGGDNQLWRITNVGSGHYEFINKVSGKALDVSENSTADGGTVDRKHSGLPVGVLACYLTLVSWVVPSCLSCSGAAW